VKTRRSSKRNLLSGEGNRPARKEKKGGGKEEEVPEGTHDYKFSGRKKGWRHRADSRRKEGAVSFSRRGVGLANEGERWFFSLLERGGGEIGKESLAAGTKEEGGTTTAAPGDRLRKKGCPLFTFFQKKGKKEKGAEDHRTPISQGGERTKKGLV